ncbi:MAG: DUF1080 domain-containing protein [Candidatus Poribacteria bacterium]|nr:DUF1080 domain-containing protein [Candidatus Poribacteria bacterium]
MKMLRTWYVCAWICFVFILAIHPALAIRFEFDSDKEIADWELGPQATAEIKDGMLELTVGGGQNSGIYFGEESWTDYRMEVGARKLVGPYFHLFVRTEEPAVDFYFMEISYNSHTTSVFMFQGGAANEITGGPRPQRPDSKDTKGGDAYTIVFEVEGETLRTYIDGKLMVETQDKTYDKGRPGLGGRDSTVAYEYVEINGPGIPPTAVEPVDKLAITWGALKSR